MTHWERSCFLHPLAHGSPSACCVQRHVRAHNSRAVPQCRCCSWTWLCSQRASKVDNVSSQHVLGVGGCWWGEMGEQLFVLQRWEHHRAFPRGMLFQGCQPL